MPIKPVKSRVLAYSNLENKNDVISICIKIRKTLATHGFLRAFQPSFSLRSKFTPKTATNYAFNATILVFFKIYVNFLHNPYFFATLSRILRPLRRFFVSRVARSIPWRSKAQPNFHPILALALYGGRSNFYVRFFYRKSPQIFSL